MWRLLAVFLALAGVALGEINVGRLTSPLYQYFSDAKHVYHHDAEFVNKFYGDYAYYIKNEGHLGYVLPYSTYTKNKEAIDEACPELVVYKSVFTPTRGSSRANFDQSFYPLESAVSAPLVDYGPIFLAASKKGYCGATKAVYLTDSNRPTIQDWFYTSNEEEYNEVITNNTWYNRSGNAKGIVFYIWEQQQDSKSPIAVSTINEDHLPRNKVHNMTSTLYRFYSVDLQKHVYHHDRAFLKLLGPNDFVKEVKMGNVLPYSTYTNNKNMVDEACPKLITLNNVVRVYGDGSRSQWDQALTVPNNSLAPGMTDNGPIFLAAKAKGYCGANRAVYLSDGNRRNKFYDWFYTTSAGEYIEVTTRGIHYSSGGNAKGIVFYIWEPLTSSKTPMLSGEGIEKMTTPLHRYFSEDFRKHVCHHDPEFLNRFYGPDAKFFFNQGHLGNVLPYSTYAKNKETIDEACPELVVYKSVFTPTRGTRRPFFDQSFVAANSSIAPRMIDEGPIFLAASKKGYCGANIPVYLTDSNAQLIATEDWFYSSDWREYEEYTGVDYYSNMRGHGKGIVFYIWELEIDADTSISHPADVPDLSEEDIKNMTSPLYRFYSGALNRHAYHHDTELLKNLLGQDAPGFAKEAEMGNVLSYATYTKNKYPIDKACPDLITLVDVRQHYRRSQWDLSFAVQNEPLITSRIAEGPNFVAAKEKGYCGATRAVYLTRSNRPAVHDWFYTTSEEEYEVITKNSSYNRPGNAKGIVFYIW